jgi:hypothetical protein
MPHCRNKSKFQSTNRSNRGKIDNIKINIHGSSLSWLGTSTSIESGVSKPVLGAQTSPLNEMTIQIIVRLHFSER